MSVQVPKGYKQTEVGVIPEDWVIRPLLSAVRIASGQVDPKNEPYRSMVLVAPDHIESSSGRLLKKVSAFEQHAISGKYLFKSGDIVYSKIRPYLKKAILADFDGLCSADMYPLQPNNGFSAGFLFASILGCRFSKYAESVSVRSGMPKINRSELADYSMAFPPRQEEQERIAEALSDTDALIESLEQLIAKKCQIKQGAMQELLTGQRRLPGFSGDWGLKKLKDLGSTYGGLTGKTKSDFGEGSSYYITFMNVMSNVVVDDEIFELVNISENESQNRVMMGDLLFNGSSETPEELGFCSVVSKPLKNVYLNSFCFGFRFKEVNKSCGLYFAYFFRSKEGRELLKSLAQGATRYNLSKTSLLNLSFRIPSLDEQIAIADVLSELDAEVSMIQSRLSKARQIKQSMMQELLTGRIRLI